MANKPDEIEVEVLADGTVKVTTGAVSAPNHKNADELLAFLARELGGPVVVEKRKHSHRHVHGGVVVKHSH